jgi:hypothetical protein
MSFALDQYSRARLPGYTGVKPQDPKNITVQQPSQGPTQQTTQGRANFETTRRPLQPPEVSHNYSSGTGHLSFFTGAPGCQRVCRVGRVPNPLMDWVQHCSYMLLCY